MRVCSGVQNLTLRWLFYAEYGLEMADFTYLHFKIGVCSEFQNLGLRRIIYRDPESGVEMAYIVHNLDFIKNLGLRQIKNLDSRRLIFYFFIFTCWSAQRSRIWYQDSVFCLKSGLEMAYSTFLH